MTSFTPNVISGEKLTSKREQTLKSGFAPGVHSRDRFHMLSFKCCLVLNYCGFGLYSFFRS